MTVGPFIEPAKDERESFMTTSYGIISGMAMAVMLAGSALAQTQTPAQAPALPKVRTAQVTEAKILTSTVRVQGGGVVSPDVVVTGPNMAAATKMAEDYFNTLNTLQAKFTQTVTGEATASVGTFSLKRPKQFLWQYETPVKQKIIGTGSAVYYVDEERNQVTQLPQNAGMARLFNAKVLNFSQQGLRATHVKSTARQMAVTFTVDKKIATSDQAGLVTLTLVFDKLAGGQLQLAQMDALDTLSVTTRVVLANVRSNVPLPSKMFAFTPGVYEQRN